MLHTIEIYFLLFISYAFLGWCMEVTCKFIQYKKFINRGFLIGPYCPIYAGHEAREAECALDVELGHQDAGGTVGDKAHQCGHHRHLLSLKSEKSFCAKVIL